MHKCWVLVALFVALPVLAAPAGAETMAQAVRAALTDNPRARVHQADVQATAYDLLSREREFLPTVSVSAEAGGFYYNDPVRLAPGNNNRVSAAGQASIAAEYVVFDGFRRANAVYRDAAAVDASIFRLLDASETLALSAIEAYVDVVRHRQLVAVSRANVARHRDIAGQVLEAVDGGRLPASDRFEAEQRVVAARLSLVRVEQALDDACARYEAITGRKPGDAMSIAWVTGLPLQRDAFVSTAIQSSLRVKAADAAVKQAQYGEGVQGADALPEVTVSTGANAGFNQNGVPGRAVDAFAKVGVEWEVFSGGRDAAKRAALMRTVQAMAERDAAVLEVRELAMTTWNAYHANIERTVLLDRQLANTRRTADQYQDQFEGGKRGLLEVLDAERAWFNARFEDVSAEASYAFNQYQILAVQSRLAAHFGVKPSDVAMTPDFEARAVEAGAFAVFNTDIPALE